MTVKEILEKAKSGELNLELSCIKDFRVNYCGGAERYLEEYKKAFRKNAAYRYRETKALLDREAVVVEDTYCNYFKNYYYIITRRSFEGPFSKPLKDHEKIIFE